MSDGLTDYEQLREKPSLFVKQVLGVEPFSYQKEFMDHPSSRKSFVSGRQVGKSRTAAWLGLHRAVTHPDETILITADAQRQASELFSALRSEMSNAGISDEAWGVDRDTQTQIEFDNGSRILCLPTGRNGNKIRGYTADMVIVDEAAFVEDEIIEDVIEPMMFVSDGHLILTSTPWGTSGYFYDKSTSWALADGKYSTWDPDTGGISSYENPLIDDEEVDEYKEGKTRVQVKQEVMGDFISNVDVFFPPELIRKCMVTSPEREVDRVHLGADLAGSGQDESVFMLIDEAGNVFSLESHDISVMESAERIRALHNIYDFESIVVDRTGLGEGPVETLKAEIGRIVDDEYLTTQKKQSVYQTLKYEMEAGNIRFPHDEKLKNQMEAIVPNTTKNGNLSLHAEHGHDDYPDALALAVWALPDTEGSDRSTGAKGATSSHTLGDLREQAGRTERTHRRGYNDHENNRNRRTSRSTGGRRRSGRR